MTGVPPPAGSTSGSLSPADWAQLEALVDALLDTPPDRRAALLAEVSGGDAARRAELERLVAECESPHPLLDQPAAKRFAALVDEQAVRVSAVLGDRYQITREIGRGGMATVYLAHDIRHSRDVAVKVLRPDLAAALGGSRFLREIEIAARLRHPNIVPLYDSGWVPATDTDAGSDGVLYYVMPYESGHSLRERLARNGRLAIDDAIIILRDICDALAHAHRNGIVHRDVKPDNVLLAGRHAMVTDFGVAKALASESSHRPAGEKPSALTTAGVSLGTPTYMAPEQIAADPRTDHRADIYAVGVVAYELLTGRPPFHSDEPQAVLAAHLSQKPEPIATHRPDVPPVLGELVMKCLEKRPVDRWQSADDLVSRLESILSPGAISGEKVVAAAPIVADQPMKSRSSKPNLRWLIGLAAGAGVVVASIFAINRARAPVDSAPALDPRKIVIVPFRVSGLDSSMRDLGEGIVDLLSAKLNGEGGPLAVDSRTTISAWSRVGGGNVGTADQARQVARMLGAGEALFGTVVGVPGSRLTITANVIPTIGGSTRPAVTVTGPVDSLPSLLDVVATRIVARGAGVTDQTLSTLTSASIPALRAYLWGRAEYRRGREREAVEHFARAIEMDSTFALAALDLVAATGQPIGMGTRCPSPECLTTYFALGFRNPGPESDHRRLMHALDVAWRHRDKLSARDRPLLEALHGDTARERNTARTLIAAFQRAATAAPDRVETYYLLGSLLLFQGRAVEIVDSRSRAAAAFRRALDLDPSYVAPMAGLVEVAAFDRDTAALRRAGALYLSYDSLSGTADYVRWRVAAGTSDEPALAALRDRFDVLDVSTLQRITHASMMSGLYLADGARATSIVVDRAADPIQRRIALGSAYMVAMNRGRPREAVDWLQRRAQVVDDPLAFWTWAPMSALFWEGDTAIAMTTVRARSARIARDTMARPRDARATLELSRHIGQQGLWDFMRGDTARPMAAVRWLRRNNFSMGADFLDAMLATRSRRPEAELLRARLDSVALEGCCSTGLVHWTNLVAARAHEEAGRDADALRAVRRGVWRFPPQLLSTFLREEGRLAAKLGDREGAIRAYRHYLALRSEPEPELRPEVDRVRAELARLEQLR